MSNQALLPEVGSVSVLVAAGDTRVRRALRAMIGAERDMRVVGEAAGLDEVPDSARRLRPDVVLLDLGSSDAVDGLALLRRLSGVQRRSVVVISMCGHLRAAVLATGASAFVEPGAEPEAILDTLRATALRTR